MAAWSKASTPRSSTPISKSCTTISEFERERVESSSRRTGMKRLLGFAVVAAALAASPVQAQQLNVKIGVLSDMSSLYADIGGPGSVAAAKLAVADFTKDQPNVKVDLISGDHQNKPDIGSNVANQWFDVDKVDLIIDVPNSGVALAVSQIAANKNRVF